MNIILTLVGILLAAGSWSGFLAWTSSLDDRILENAASVAEATPPNNKLSDGKAKDGDTLPWDEKRAWNEAASLKLPKVVPQEGPGIHNVFQLSENFVTGSEPETVDSLRYLAKRGVKTIVSVDGKVPDHETAKKLGMRYVHIPIQYSGLRQDEIMKLVKTFRELEGPFFVHCFHGRHRGPAAAAIGRRVVDGASRNVCLAEMRQWSGTGELYGGLYAAVANCEVPDGKVSAAYDFPFPPAHQFEGLRSAMVGMARSYHGLKQLGKNDWHPVEDHPDLDAQGSAAHLYQTLIQCRDLEDKNLADETYKSMLAKNIEAARVLHEQVKRFRAGEESLRGQLMSSVKDVKDNCNACHRVYRN